ncbi:hypothetical protein, partial [Thermodesulfovibrio sp.]|uniref:hypothetical protein n=1 Tax=Thermodesulfovibrio sp. TaxID=2067987 RepID=UPI00309891E9
FDLGAVVIAKQVENTMHNQPHQFIAKRNASLGCLMPSSIHADVDFTVEWITAQRKTDDIGCPVVPKVARVEVSNHFVIAEDDAD